MSKKKKLIILFSIVVVLLVFVAVYIVTNRIKSEPSEPDYSSISGEYVLDDSQSYWKGVGLHDFTATEDGYYFLTSDMQYLKYFDYDTKEVIIACAKPECNHKSSSCNAYMGSRAYIADNIYYHDGYLYYMKYSGGMSVLVRMDTAGNNSEEITEIMPSGQDSSTKLVFHGDYAYAYYQYVHYTLDEEFTEVIKRISLKDGSTKDIYEISGKNISIANVKSYGDKLYFEVQEQAEKRSYNSKTRGLYTYDYQTGNISLVSDENVSDYCIIPEKNIFAYYVTGQGLYFSDINEQTTQLILKSDKTYDMCSLSYDGKYVYMDNILYQVYYYSYDDRNKKCMVLNTSGEQINEISCDSVMTMYFGDSRCMFAWRDDNSSEYMYIDKKNIENAGTWEIIGE